MTRQVIRLLLLASNVLLFVLIPQPPRVHTLHVEGHLVSRETTLRQPTQDHPLMILIEHREDTQEDSEKKTPQHVTLLVFEILMLVLKIVSQLVDQGHQLTQVMTDPVPGDLTPLKTGIQLDHRFVTDLLWMSEMKPLEALGIQAEAPSGVGHQSTNPMKRAVWRRLKRNTPPVATGHLLDSNWKNHPFQELAGSQQWKQLKKSMD